MNSWKRKLLALAAVPLLAVPSAAGVFLWLSPHIGGFFAGLTAAGFESLYIGINVLIITTPELRRYARNVALSGVATAVIFNTLARYQAMVCAPTLALNPKAACTMRDVTFDGLALGLAVLESIPLAGLAYAISVLLHRLSEEIRPRRAAHRARVARALWRLRSQARSVAQARAAEHSLSAMLAQAQAEAAQLKDAHAQQAAELVDALHEAAQARASAESWQHQAAQLQQDAARWQSDAERSYAGESEALRTAAQQEATIAQLRDELARTQAERAQYGDTAAQLRATNAQLEAELAQIRVVDARMAAELAQLEGAGDLDKRALAQALRDAGLSTRRAAELLRTSESTLRSWTQAPRRVSSAAD